MQIKKLGEMVQIDQGNKANWVDPLRVILIEYNEDTKLLHIGCDGQDHDFDNGVTHEQYAKFVDLVATAKLEARIGKPLIPRSQDNTVLDVIKESEGPKPYIKAYKGLVMLKTVNDAHNNAVMIRWLDPLEFGQIRYDKSAQNMAFTYDRFRWRDDTAKGVSEELCAEFVSIVNVAKQELREGRAASRRPGGSSP